jgi:hypothetical protein
MVDGSVWHYLALLASALNDESGACRAYELALAANQTLAAPALVARTMLEYGLYLFDHPDLQSPRNAADLLADSHDLYAALGCGFQAERARAALAKPGDSSKRVTVPVPAELSHDGRNLFRQEGDFWSIRFDNSLIRIRHSLGMKYIAELIAARGNEVHVLDLVTSDPSDRQTIAAFANEVPDSRMDPQARLQYRRRLAELDEDLEIAQTCNDVGLADRLQHEREAICAELESAYGLSGRIRTAPTTLERARISVRNRITSALNAIKKHDESAWKHFDVSLKTGRTCSYRPEHDPDWVL